MLEVNSMVRYFFVTFWQDVAWLSQKLLVEDLYFVCLLFAHRHITCIVEYGHFFSS